MIHLLKYDGILPVAERLGSLLAEAILKLEGDSPLGELLVVAVPLHAAKRKQRGFNHADLLAKAAVRELRRRRPEWKLTFAGDALERRKATLSQAGLSPHQRRANLRGVFFVAQPELVAGREILLIDDIYTTGATARACSQVLRRAGATSVRVATVARPQRENVSAPQFQDEDLPMAQDVAFWGSGREETASAGTATAGAMAPVATAANRQPEAQQHRGFGG
jgi:ComF family protein